MSILGQEWLNSWKRMVIESGCGGPLFTAGTRVGFVSLDGPSTLRVSSVSPDNTIKCVPSIHAPSWANRGGTPSPRAAQALLPGVCRKVPQAALCASNHFTSFACVMCTFDFRDSQQRRGRRLGESWAHLGCQQSIGECALKMPPGRWWPPLLPRGTVPTAA